MSETMSIVETRKAEIVRELRALPVLADVTEPELARLAEGREHPFVTGEMIVVEGKPADRFGFLLEGSIRVYRTVGGVENTLIRHSDPGPICEVSILTNGIHPVSAQAITSGRYLEYSIEEFWEILSHCPQVRAIVLDFMNKRSRNLQTADLQQEKLASLGTLTAGLMHELNNPGTAASRAAMQLRENLNRMHSLAKKFSEEEPSKNQMQCLWVLQERAMMAGRTMCMGSLEQADAEDAVAQWLDSNDVEESWRMAPALVASGITVEDLQCIKDEFDGESVNLPLQWLEAMVSSMQLVGTIEESITRVSDLVKAVKSYAHEGQGENDTVEINESVHATLMILKHKIYEKEITLEKQFGPNLPPLHCACSGLNQVWTNVLDNAIDAAPHGGHIRIKTWSENAELFVSIADDGPGIPAESMTKIFDPFYTTKPMGVGTGLGLGIAHRIVTEYGGSLHVTSEPGNTVFVTQLPLQSNPN
jgi:signal transduction histidine kinase